MNETEDVQYHIYLDEQGRGREGPDRIIVQRHCLVCGKLLALNYPKDDEEPAAFCLKHQTMERMKGFL